MLHVDGVAQRAFYARLWRVRTKPITLRLGSHGAIHRVGDAVAKRLVKAANRVVSVGDIEHIVWRPPVVEAMRPNAGHAALGHLFDFVIAEQVPFIDYDPIQPGVGRIVSDRTV